MLFPRKPLHFLAT